jgi:hypothetical protein
MKIADFSFFIISALLLLLLAWQQLMLSLLDFRSVTVS